MSGRKANAAFQPLLMRRLPVASTRALRRQYGCGCSAARRALNPPYLARNASNDATRLLDLEPRRFDYRPELAKLLLHELAELVRRVGHDLRSLAVQRIPDFRHVHRLDQRVPQLVEDRLRCG